MSTTWRGRSDDEPPVRFGARARTWLRRRIRQELFTPSPFGTPGQVVLRSNGKPWFAEMAERMIDWYLARYESYVRWEEDDGYRGRDYARGEWAFLANAVKADFGVAVAECARDHDAETYRTLDDWLRADLEDRLWYNGDQGGMRTIVARARSATPRTARRLWLREARWRFLAQRQRPHTPRRRR